MFVSQFKIKIPIEPIENMRIYNVIEYFYLESSQILGNFVDKMSASTNV